MRVNTRKWLFGGGLCVFVFVELQKLELKLKTLEKEIKNNDAAMMEMRQKLRAERLKIKEFENMKKKISEASADGGENNVDSAGGGAPGVLQLPKKAEQIRKEQENVAAAREHAEEEEQAKRGVIAEPLNNNNDNNHIDNEVPVKSDRVSNSRGVLLNRNGQTPTNKGAIVKKFFADLVMPYAEVGQDMCRAISNMSAARSDIQMLDLYNTIPFDDPDGGVWKQGFDIKYDEEKVKQEKRLEIIVTPHSHTDPGWITTFEGYYNSQTKYIFENMLLSLQSMERMRFIYAEMSFFEKWWAEINDEQRAAVQRLLHQGRLEIVSGAWVMTDEANAHYFATVSEWIEGHEWIANHIPDYKPKNHWSIDPFGLSSTLAFVVSKANLSNALVQRVHYSVKKHLAEQKQLEFKWRQLWSGADASNDLFTHVMPFYSYDVPHTCGPDPKVCCQFDFWRLSGQAACPWGVPPEEITERNLARRAAILYDQYRKKAQLFRRNVLFVPLGDDFRYGSAEEWRLQHDNYIRLFDYINAKKEWNVHVRFGTLGDYFELDHARVEEFKGEADGEVPVLSGDFFTYADRNDHYWSGYYTSRPFYKRMDRVLQHYLRSAEIIVSLAISKDSRAESIIQEMYGLLVEARRHMSLFQHHDGVTGTAKDDVVVDYGQNEVVVFNSLAQPRHEVVCVQTKHLKTEVSRPSYPNIPVPQQIAPVLKRTSRNIEFEFGKYELCFMATVPPFGFEVYKLHSTPNAVGGGASKVSLRSRKKITSSDFMTELIQEPYFDLDNEFVEAHFDATTGLLKSVTPSDGHEVSVNLSFVQYGVRSKNPGKFQGGDDLSGAYLFLPNGPAREMRPQNGYQYVVVDGPIMKKTDIYDCCHGLLLLAISDCYCYFVIIFQMIKRKRFAKLPLQAHFYPMPTSAFIEDNSNRMTIFSAQSLGVASLESGWLEVMLDRRLNQDDGRGLFQGVTDNKITRSKFRLLIEPLDVNKRLNREPDSKSTTTAYHSLVGHYVSLQLQYPLMSMFSSAGQSETMASPTDYNEESNKKYAPAKSKALILHRLGAECGSKLRLHSFCSTSDGKVKVSKLFEGKPTRIRETSLTLLYEGNSNDNFDEVQIKPMDMRTFRLDFTRGFS
ncbi:unnamed protein product [Anisakis simplex]|uniref:mannosyl-oligosaccharide 1,3-1,6-alpha-mannosidase n=1 Tax=Anisakis simplex TaxID=6269 RepID=A0A158PNG6_ANISI|nr:unnamed protein product [Anisakis simplex]